jgi:hypothetical protein
MKAIAAGRYDSSPGCRRTLPLPASASAPAGQGRAAGACRPCGPATGRAGAGRRWRARGGAYRRSRSARKTSRAGGLRRRHQHGRAGGRRLRRRADAGDDARTARQSRLGRPLPGFAGLCGAGGSARRCSTGASCRLRKAALAPMASNTRPGSSPGRRSSCSSINWSAIISASARSARCRCRSRSSPPTSFMASGWSCARAA